jgi:hypothetical protein
MNLISGSKDKNIELETAKGEYLEGLEIQQK